MARGSTGDVQGNRGVLDKNDDVDITQQDSSAIEPSYPLKERAAVRRNGALYDLPPSAERWTRFAIFTILTGGNAISQGLNDAWLSINATTSTKRSIGLAKAVMGSNLGGLVGPQLFQPSDAPRYSKGFLGILLLYTFCIPITCVIMWVYWRDNKKLKGRGTDETGSASEIQRFDI